MDNRRTDPRALLLFLILISYWQYGPDQQQSFAQHRLYQDHIEREHAALRILNNSFYGDFSPRDDRWLNLTGLRQSDGYAWELLDDVKRKVHDYTDRYLGDKTEPALNNRPDEFEDPLLYRNVTGFVAGEWVRSGIRHGSHGPRVNLSALVPEGTYSLHGYARNITSASGAIQVHLEENSDIFSSYNQSVKEISATITLEDDTRFGDWWEMKLHGVHFAKFGEILLTTTSDKFPGIFALPHFALTRSTYLGAQQLLNRTLSDAIYKQLSNLGSPWNPWSSTSDGAGADLFALPHCEYVVYLQQREASLGSLSTMHSDKRHHLLQLIEEELRFPTGASLPATAPMTMSMIAFSPDCGFVIESKGPPIYAPEEGNHLQGIKLELFIQSTRRDTLVLAAVLFLQMVLVVKQNKEASTPSTRSRISFYTIAMLAFGDGLIGMMLISYIGFISSALSVLFVAGFLALLSFVFEMRFLQEIWTVQATERRAPARERTGNAVSTQASQTTHDIPQTDTAAQTDSLPQPATARLSGRDTGATPVILPPDQDIEAPEMGTTSIYGELSNLVLFFFFLLLVTSFLSFVALSWPVTIRSAYANILAIMYLSFWCPQIYRNVVRNCRKAFRWDFVIGHSILRLTPFIYFYALPNNVMFSKNDTQTLTILMAWVWVQILMLASQDMLGPRFFVREGWAPPAYDYHPVLREDEEGAFMPIGMAEPSGDATGSLAGSGEDGSKGKKKFGCTICTQDIDVFVIPAGGATESTGIGSALLARRTYMITPCRHIFHTQCLEGWMRYRLQCPNCREGLPPL